MYFAYDMFATGKRTSLERKQQYFENTYVPECIQYSLRDFNKPRVNRRPCRCTVAVFR